jgi:predicted aspartyl protease
LEFESWIGWIGGATFTYTIRSRGVAGRLTDAGLASLAFELGVSHVERDSDMRSAFGVLAIGLIVVSSLVVGVVLRVTIVPRATKRGAKTTLARRSESLHNGGRSKVAVSVTASDGASYYEKSMAL